MSEASGTITPAQRELYHTEGYFIAPAVIPAEHLENGRRVVSSDPVEVGV